MRIESHINLPVPYYRSNDVLDVFIHTQQFARVAGYLATTLDALEVKPVFLFMYRRGKTRTENGFPRTNAIRSDRRKKTVFADCRNSSLNL